MTSKGILWLDSQESNQRRQNTVIQQLMEGRSNATGIATLSSGAVTSTTVTARTCGGSSAIFMFPQTASAISASAYVPSTDVVATSLHRTPFEFHLYRPHLLLGCPWMIIEPADPVTVHIVWPFLRDKARKACEKVGVSKFEDLERNTLDGTDMAWVVRDGQAIYGLVTTVRFEDACEITQCLGVSLHAYKFREHLKTIERHARKDGLKVMRLYGRKGWKRILKDYQVMQEHKNYIVLERPL